jgi:hypothetical protein
MCDHNINAFNNHAFFRGCQVYVETVGFKSTVHPTEIDTLESQQTEKIETKVKYVNRIESIQVCTILSSVSFWGVPFTQYHICTTPPLPTGPLQERKLPDGQF